VGGEVIVTKKAEEDPVNLLRDGDMFGQLSLLYDTKRQATCTTGSTLILFDYAIFFD
jgi:CRP-like cAMP-binding protein